MGQSYERTADTLAFIRGRCQYFVSNHHTYIFLMIQRTAFLSALLSTNTHSAGKGKGSCIQRLLSILNLLLCAGMMTLGILTLIGFNKTMDISEAFVAAYMILFAALLALYEFMWWSTIDSINKSMRKNFGFLYGIKGKAFYLIFIAFLTIGLEVSIRWLRYTVGIAFLADGALHLFLLFSKPDLVSSYSAPSGGLSESGDAVV